MPALFSALTMLLAAIASPAEGPPKLPQKLSQSAAQFGFVQKAGNQVLLETESTNVNANTQITVVVFGKNQSFSTAQLIKKLNPGDLDPAQVKLSATDSGRGLNVYLIKLNRPLNNFTNGIAALAPSTSFMIEGAKVAMSIGTLPPAHFRSCATAQGMHFSVWLGKELSGARIWHYYLALGYDGSARDKSVCRCENIDY